MDEKSIGCLDLLESPSLQMKSNSTNFPIGVEHLVLIVTNGELLLKPA